MEISKFKLHYKRQLLNQISRLLIVYLRVMRSMRYFKLFEPFCSRIAGRKIIFTRKAKSLTVYEVDFKRRQQFDNFTGLLTCQSSYTQLPVKKSFFVVI